MPAESRLSVMRSTYFRALFTSIVLTALTFAAVGCQSATDSPDDGNGVIPSTEFAIAISAVEEVAQGMAYDGTNYLVGWQSDHPVSGQSIVRARLFSQAGAPSGAGYDSDTTFGGDPPYVAFDGTRYLLAWGSRRNGISTIWGQFIATSGAADGSRFTITGGGSTFGGVVGLAYGGGTYLIAYARETATTGSATFTTYGRLVSPSGALGTELTFSTATNEGFNSVAFDGTRFLTVFSEASSISGRFVSTTGVLSSGVTIYAGSQPFEPGVTVGFNGTNYGVTLALKTPNGVDAYLQLVAPAGANVGGLITIAADPANDEFPVGSVGAGGNFLVSYLDNLSLAGQQRVRARFVSGAGAAVGPSVTLAGPKSGKVPFGGVFHSDGTKYFLLITRGIPDAADPSDFSQWSQTDIFGAFPTIPSP